MNMFYFRHPSRRSLITRRITDRREIPYPFGSQEWLENVKKHYLVWPQSNRREAGTSTNDRRAAERRRRPFSEQRHSEEKCSMPLLTQEERKLIEDLYLNDNGD